jgi:hypothetical protein
MHKKNIIYILVILFLSVYIGYREAENSWDKTVYYYIDNEDRTPAAVKSLISVNKIVENSLHRKISDDLFSEPPKIKFKKNFLEIGFNQFFISDKNNMKLACQVFQDVNVIFHAKNISNSGQPIIMKVDFPCLTDPESIDKIKSVKIDLKDFIESNERTAEYLNVGNGYKLSISNLSDSLPKSWQLMSIELTNSTDKQVKPILIDNFTKKDFGFNIQ